MENNSSLWGFQHNSGIVRVLFYSATPDQSLSPYFATQGELEDVAKQVGYPNVAALATQEDFDALEFSEVHLPLHARVNCRYRATDWALLGSPPTVDDIEKTIRANCEVLVDVQQVQPPNGGHVILIIGFDADREVFFAKNSWGEDGFIEIAYQNDPVWMIQAAHYIRGVADPTYVQNEACWLGNWWFHQDGQVGRLLIRRFLDFRNLGKPTKLGNLYIGGKRFDVNGSLKNNGMVLDMHISQTEGRVAPGTLLGTHIEATLSHADIFNARGQELGINIISRSHSPVLLTRFSTRFAGIWSQEQTAPWQARHGLTGDGYQTTFEELRRQGFRPVQVCGYSEGFDDRYAAIFSQSPSGPWEARHRLTAEQYQTRFDELLQQGYRLRNVSGYAIAGSERFTGIWEQADGPPWQARHGITGDDLQKTFDQLTPLGYRPLQVSGYRVNVGVRFTGIWEQRPGGTWHARHNLSSEDYQKTFDALVAQGYRLLWVSGYSFGGATRYAAIWEQSPGPTWQARHGLDGPGYQAAFDGLTANQFNLIQVCGYGVGFP